MLRPDELLTEDKFSLSNAVFHFASPLTSDVTVSLIVEVLSQKASIQYITIFSSFAWAERRKNEKSDFRAQISQADGSLIPGFAKQRIRSPDTLFFYAIRVGVASEH